MILSFGGLLALELRLFSLSLILCLAAFFASPFGVREAQLLILAYHHVDDAGGETTISLSTFDSHLSALTENGFSFVGFDDVISFVEGRSPLPERPVCIVFDDGYLSNYSLAFPVLLKHGAKATFCVIGSAVGHDRYKDTDRKVIPHFSWEQAREMTSMGLISIGSHTFDMHMHPEYEGGAVREYAVPLSGESVADFESAFRIDCERMSRLMAENLGQKPLVFAYPHGVWDGISEQVLKEHGYRVTLTTEAGYNTVSVGNADCLYLLKRYSVNDSTHILDIIEAFNTKN